MSFAGWFKNFNRYNNGSESEFGMSVFNHKAAMSDRKSSQSGVFIRNPFLRHRHDPAKGADRACRRKPQRQRLHGAHTLCVPSVQSKVRWNRERKSPSFDIAAAWREILSRLYRHCPAVDSCGEIIPEDVPFSPEALDRLFSWQNEVTDRCNAEGSDTPLPPLRASSKYARVRFSLLLALADRACGDEKKIDRRRHRGARHTPDRVFPRDRRKGAGHRKRGRFDGVAACRTIGTARHVHYRRGCGNRREMWACRAQFQAVHQRPQRRSVRPFRPRKLH